MISRFGRPVPQLSMVVNQMMDKIDSEFGHLLRDLNQPWLSADNFIMFADAIHAKGAALNNTWGFTDGTVCPISRPRIHQRIVHNGHKRQHALKDQSITAPNGMIANLYGPVEEKRHDATMLRISGLIPILENFSLGPQHERLFIYGDPVYSLRCYLQAPFREAHLIQQQKAFSDSMAKVRVSVEWLFGNFINNFKFSDFKKNQKIVLRNVGKMYRVSALLTNAHISLYRNNCTNYSDLDHPTLEKYFF